MELAKASIFKYAKYQPPSKQLQKAQSCTTRRLAHTDFMGTINIANLSAEERLRLLEELWDSLSATPEAVPLTHAQREELDRRLDELERDGPADIPWEEVLQRIRSRSH